MLFDQVCHSYQDVLKYGYMRLSDIKWMLMIPSVRVWSGAQAFFEKAWNDVSICILIKL